MTGKNLLAYLLFWCSCGLGMAQARLPQLYFHHLTVEKGLSQAFNLFVYKDSRGLVWISSVNGLNRFDGQSVRVYQPNPQNPGAIYGNNIQGPFFEDAGTNIWFATHEAINCYIRKSDAFRHFTRNQEPSYFSLGMDALGRFWFLHQHRFVCYLDTRFPDRAPVVVHEVSANTNRGYLRLNASGLPEMLLCFSLGTPGIQLFEYDDQFCILRQELLFSKASAASPALAPVDAFFTSSGDGWVATQHSLLRFPAGDAGYEQFGLERLQDQPALSGIAPLLNGQIACGTSSHGLWFFDPLTGSFYGSLRHVPDMPSTLAADQVDAVATDADGGLWVSLNGIGIDFTHLNKNKFKRFASIDNGMDGKADQNPGRVLEDRQGLTWATTYKAGIILLDTAGRQIAHYHSGAQPPYDLPSNRIYDIFQDRQGRIWVSSHKGLLLLPPGSQRFQAVDPAQSYLYGLQLQDGRLLFCRFQGGVWALKESPVLHGNSHSDKVFDFQLLAGIPTESPWTYIYEDKQGRLWGSHDLEAVSVFEPSGQDFRHLTELPIRGEVSTVWEVAGHNKFWIGASPGLFSVDGTDFRVKMEGFEDLSIAGLIPFEKNVLWVGTDRGLFQHHTVSGESYGFQPADGLSSLQIGFRSLMHCKNGSFRFGSGVDILDWQPHNADQRLAAAVPQITAITINDTFPQSLRCGTTSAASPMEMKTLRLRHHENLLGFTLTASEYSDPAHCRIRYFLDGVDKDTVEALSGVKIRYSNLPPGRFKLSVWASNSDGIWNPNPHELDIQIRPAFWQTAWFRLLVVGALVSIIWLFFYTRDMERQRLQQLRDQLSRDLHDELGSTLSSISILSESARQSGGLESVSLDQIGQRVREAMESVSDMVWAIKPQNDPMPVVLRRMRRFAADMLEPQGIRVQFVIPTPVHDIILPSEQRKELYLIFKEAVNNAAKYSCASQVEVELNKMGKCLVLQITDDGKGFNPANIISGPEVRYGGNGLRNMQHRAEMLKANLSIQSKPEAGTVIRLEMPLLP